MKNLLIEKCIQEGFYSCYYDVQQAYLKNETIPEDDFEKEVLMVGWFMDSINAGGMDGFIYSKVGNYYSTIYKTLNKIEANYIIEALNLLASNFKDGIPDDIDLRFEAIDKLRANMNDDYWEMIEKIDAPILYGNGKRVDEFFINYCQKIT